MDDAVLAKEMLFAGWLNLLRLRLRLNGKECDRTLVEHPSGAAVLAYDADRQVATILYQTRYAPLFLSHRPLPEPIVGAFDGNSPEETVRREALEEAGLELFGLEPVGVVWMTPSTTTERVHLFLATYDQASRVGLGGGLIDEGESIYHTEIRLPILWKQIRSGSISDAKLYMLVHALYVKAPELFLD